MHKNFKCHLILCMRDAYHFGMIAPLRLWHVTISTFNGSLMQWAAPLFETCHELEKLKLWQIKKEKTITF